MKSPPLDVHCAVQMAGRVVGWGDDPHHRKHGRVQFLSDLLSSRQVRNISVALLHNPGILKKLKYHVQNAQQKNAGVISEILPYFILLQTNLLQILRG